MVRFCEISFFSNETNIITLRNYFWNYILKYFNITFADHPQKTN